jgi:4-hydroxy-2-oxoheptanedioate aldolase
MRGNRVKEKLAAGQIATALSTVVDAGDMIDFVGPLGFDAIWLEGEHGGVTWNQLGDLSRACDLWGMAPLLRIQGKEPGRITRSLDRGVSGLIVPHVNTREEAAQIVRAAKFAPLGERGIYGGRRSYGTANYFQMANDEIFIAVIIEEMQAVENLAEILTVDHIDVFFVAPGDLAQSMGFIGQIHHPRVQATVEKALRQIVAAGRVAGALSTEPTLARDVELGVKFFTMSLGPWIQAGAQQYLAGLAELAGAS